MTQVKMDEVKMEETKKGFEMTTGQKVLVWGGVFVGTLIGYRFGYHASRKALDKGLEICFDHDPTLKEHLCKTITDVSFKKLMEN